MFIFTHFRIYATYVWIKFHIPKLWLLWLNKNKTKHVNISQQRYKKKKEKQFQGPLSCYCIQFN